MCHPETFRKQLSVALQEHVTINDAINDLRTFWIEVSELGCGPKYEEMGTRIIEFRKRLIDHFLEEEQLFKILEDAGDDATCDKVQHLRDEHAEFLERMADDIERLKCNSSTFANWECVRDEIDDIIDHLADHEAEEHDLIDRFLQNKELSSH